jgi:hypothetical protein
MPTLLDSKRNLAYTQVIDVESTHGQWLPIRHAVVDNKISRQKLKHKSLRSDTILSKFCKMSLVSLVNEKAHNKSYQPTFLNLSGFLDEEFSDVTVTVSYEEFEPQIYKLHRNVLSGECAIFFLKQKRKLLNVV